MPPFFFATTPEGVEKISKKLNPENFKEYGPADTHTWISQYLDNVKRDKLTRSETTEHLPTVDELSAFAIEASLDGKRLVRADLEDEVALEALSRRTGASMRFF